MKKPGKFKLGVYSLCMFAMISLISINARCQYYTSVMPAFYTGAGNTGERFTMAVEIGKQWEVFSLGLDLGKTNMSRQTGTDTTFYAELRTNLNVFQQGKFTNTLTLGAGYVFNAKQNILLETTTGVEYSISDKYHFNLFFGTYYFSGKQSAFNNNFFGLSLVHFFSDKKKQKSP